MRIFTADSRGVISFPVDVVGREIFFVGDSALVADASEETTGTVSWLYVPSESEIERRSRALSNLIQERLRDGGLL